MQEQITLFQRIAVFISVFFAGSGFQDFILEACRNKIFRKSLRIQSGKPYKGRSSFLVLVNRDIQNFVIEIPEKERKNFLYIIRKLCIVFRIRKQFLVRRCISWLYQNPDF